MKSWISEGESRRIRSISLLPLRSSVKDRISSHVGTEGLFRILLWSPGFSFELNRILILPKTGSRKRLPSIPIGVSDPERSSGLLQFEPIAERSGAYTPLPAALFMRSLLRAFAICYLDLLFAHAESAERRRTCRFLFIAKYAWSRRLVRWR